jgi:peptidoglycan/LPS O-acetylase OafA/YrhL
MAYFWPGMAVERSFSDYIVRFWPEALKSMHNIQLPGRPARPGWGHLWFIAYLFIMCIFIRPVVAHVMDSFTVRLKNNLAKVSQSVWLLPLLAFPFILVIAVMSPIWPLYQNSLLGDWAWFMVNTLAYVYGYLLCSQDSFWQTVDVYRIQLMVLALISAVLIAFYGVAPVIKPSYTLSYQLYAVVLGLNIWFAITGLLSLSRRFLRGQSRILRYLAPASYAIYFLHLFLLVIIGAWLTELRLGPGLEFLLLTTISLAASLLIYEFVIRRFRFARFLFGLK